MFSNGLSNVSQGNGFFDGGLQAAGFGALSGAMSFGIGEAFGSLGGFGKELGRAGAHGLSSGFITGTGNAWQSGASFGEGFSAGGIGAGIGGFVGGTFGGISAGIKSAKYEGNFWNGDKYTTFSTSLSISGSSDTAIPYDQQTALKFSDKYFKEVPGLNSLKANGLAPEGYKHRNGVFISNKKRKCIRNHKI